MNNNKPNYQRLLVLYELWETTSKDLNEFKKFLKNLSESERNIIKNIIIFKKIKNILDNSEDKIKILLSIYSKYKQKVFSKFYIFKILQINSTIIKILNKELFKLKPIEEQKQIRKKSYENARKKYNALTPENKKIFNQMRIKKKINKIGYENYRLSCNKFYKKWYHNLNSEKKLEYSYKRKNKYKLLPEERKQQNKNNRNNKLQSLSSEEKKNIYLKYYMKRKENINNMNLIDRQNFKDNLNLRKKKYFDNLSIEKKNIINKIRKIKRQYNKNYITLEEFIQKKKNIMEENNI